LIPGLTRSVDIVFPKACLAVFVDGCFWHGCPLHGTQPKSNADWWRLKIRQNMNRDRDTNRRLQKLGWDVLRIWEHEAEAVAPERVIEAYVRNLRMRLRPKRIFEQRHPTSS
jgi:DNA mismatch endonuclease (patch repair protein)